MEAEKTDCNRDLKTSEESSRGIDITRVFSKNSNLRFMLGRGRKPIPVTWSLQPEFPSLGTNQNTS